MLRFNSVPVALPACVAAVSMLTGGCDGKSQPTAPSALRPTDRSAPVMDGAPVATPLRRVGTVGGSGGGVPGDEPNYIVLTVRNGELSAGLGSLGITDPTELPASPVGIFGLGGTGRFADAGQNCVSEISQACLTGTLTFAPGTVTLSLTYTLAPPGKAPKSFLVEGTIPYTILRTTPCGFPDEIFVAPVYLAKGQIQGLGNVSLEFGGECLAG
jgi:hypothetical protein